MKGLFVPSFFALLLQSATPALAHGEDTPGPSGGYIKMPGAFHTELVPTGKDTVQVYLLDMTFKNPTVKNSKVDGKLRSKEGVEMLFSCTQEATFFQCKLPASLAAHAGGHLILIAEREGQKGVPASYDLPLKRGK